jgi:hypothetical protein
MMESLLSKMAPVHSTLVATPSKTVVPATEADTNFVFMQQWVCHWMHSLNAVQALSLV